MLSAFTHQAKAMPRSARLSRLGVTLHLIQSRNDRRACFTSPDDCRFYLDLLEDRRRRQGCRVRAFALMTRHVHLLMTADEAEATGRLMKVLGQRYVRHANRTYRGTGTSWERHFRSCPVQTSSCFLACQRYTKMNPARATHGLQTLRVPIAHLRTSCSRRNGSPADASPDLPCRTQHEELAAGRLSGAFRRTACAGMTDILRTATSGNFTPDNDRFAAEVTSAPRRALFAESANSRHAGLPATPMI